MDSDGQGVVGDRNFEILDPLGPRLFHFFSQNRTRCVGNVEFSFHKLAKATRSPGEGDIDPRFATRLLFECLASL